MSFWSCTIWPLTAHKNGTSSWTVACLGAHGYVLALGGRLPYTCTTCHIAPSHRRFAHPSWIAGMKLMLDLLLGARKHRYLRTRQVDPRPAQVYVRGFSAGSYSGICFLHLLWNMPHVQVGGILGGVAFSPALLHGIQPDHGAQLMLIHLTTDRLMCTEGNCPGRHPILVCCQWPFCARPKTHAWLWNHQEQLVSPDVSHPGQEIQAESLKGRKWTDYTCQCEYIFF